MSIKQYQHYCRSLWHPFQLPMQWALCPEKKSAQRKVAESEIFNNFRLKLMRSISHVGLFCHLRALTAFSMLWQLRAQYTAQTKSDALTSHCVSMKSIMKLGWSKRLIYIFVFVTSIWIQSPHAFTLLSRLWIGQVMTTWQHIMSCEIKHISSRQKKGQVGQNEQKAV